jgi:hypothetical protein
MRRLLTFLAVALLLVLPVVALAQTAPATPTDLPVFSADPVGYLEAVWPRVLVILGTLFGIARVIVAYVPTPAADATGFWPVLYRVIMHASLPTPQTATPQGRMAAGAAPPASRSPADQFEVKFKIDASDALAEIDKMARALPAPAAPAPPPDSGVATTTPATADPHSAEPPA